MRLITETRPPTQECMTPTAPCRAVGLAVAPKDNGLRVQGPTVGTHSQDKENHMKRIWLAIKRWAIRCWECATKQCTYYQHYLAYGPAELTHIG